MKKTDTGYTDYMKLKEYTVRLCRKEEYDQLIGFLHDHWNARHVFCRNREIFEFQHGKAENGEFDFIIAVHNQSGEIHAVLGFISSSRYDEGDMGRPIAVYGALWKVRDDIVNKEIGKLGLATLQYLLKRYPDSEYITLGLSSDSQRIYEALHFDFGAMDHSYIASENVEDFKIADDPFVEHIEINDRYEIKEIGKVPEDFVNIYHPEKNASYITNRYLLHPFYHYELLGIFKEGSLKMIFVIRKIDVNDSSCLRIVDMIASKQIPDRIDGNIRHYLKEKDAEYIDCYSHGIPVETFENMGFSFIEGNTVIPNYFEPFEKKNVDIYYAAYSKEPVVIFKGDGDQDRPNLWE